MTNKALEIVEQRWTKPAMTVQEAVSAYQEMAKFVQAALHEGTDFGVIPGTQKPTLYKPGAEKLNKFFALKPSFDIVAKEQNWEKGFFYYHMRCNLYHGAELIANADGSCNSLEKKYRYRNIPEFKATEEEKAKAVKQETRRSKQGKDYVMLTIENPDPFDLDNTILKMAQKRAFVAATLLAVNGSEYFTQDLEDIIEADYKEIGPYDSPPMPPQATRIASKPPDTTKAQSETGKLKSRPLSPETLKEFILRRTAENKEKGRISATQPQRGVVVGTLQTIFDGNDIDRYSFTKWLFGVASSKELEGAQVHALLDWLSLESVDGQLIPSAHSVEEAKLALRFILEIEGQLALESE